jgi:hypothetical protein
MPPTRESSCKYMVHEYVDSIDRVQNSVQCCALMITVINFRIQEGRYIFQLYHRFSAPQDEIYSRVGDGSK